VNDSTSKIEKFSSIMCEVANAKNTFNAHVTTIIEFVSIDLISESKSKTSSTTNNISRVENTSIYHLMKQL
jgi:hypothetical protein